MTALRTLGRWVSDWRNGATLVASVLVALLALVVVDSIQGRRASDARADRTIAELEITVQELRRRGERIDALADQLETASTSRDQLSEEVRALRELMIDRGVIEPRPQQRPPAAQPDSPPAAETPRTGPGEPAARRSPRPSSQPSPRPPPSRPSPAPSPPPGSPSPAPRPPVLPFLCPPVCLPGG